MQTLPEFIAKHNITLSSKSLPGRNDHMGQTMPPGSTHWVCLLKFSGRQMTIKFSMGPAYKGQPDIRDVLSSIASDASVKYSCTDALDFMEEFGYTSASETRKIYRACLKEYDQILRLLGQEVLDELLFDTEGY